MLLKGYTYETMSPECNTRATTINAIAKLSEDVSAVLPYLASVIDLCKYDHPNKILSFKRKGKRVNIFPKKITVTNLLDRDEAEIFLEELKTLINDTYQTRNNINPSFKKGAEIKSLDVFKLLPGTNCKKCGEATCLAFAAMIVQQESEVAHCEQIFEEKYVEKRGKLFSLLETAGFKINK